MKLGLGKIVECGDMLESWGKKQNGESDYINDNITGEVICKPTTT